MFARFCSFFSKAKSGETEHNNNKSNDKNENVCSVAVEDVTSDTLSSNESSTSAHNNETVTVSASDNNSLACESIAQKLNDIAEVAEQLDEAIRDAQLSVSSSDVLESNSNSSSTDKCKMDNMHSASSEDWQSRSTEDDSFATASEGNFTQHSHSSSFQTASGRTSSYISSDKNSLDASDVDEPTISFEQVDKEQHSGSITPTNYDNEDTGLESDLDGASSSIVDGPLPVSTEVSANTLHANCLHDTNNADHEIDNNNKSDAAWRSNKYYENITKQTIKGFL